MLSLAGIISRLNKKREEKEFRLLSFLSRDGRRKNVSRRRVKKGRLRRDARAYYREVGGFYDPEKNLPT